MAKIQRTFVQGKMNKDLDERLIPNGQYRDALNIQVSTSEGSDVGAVENVLGNTKVNLKSTGPNVRWDSNFGLSGTQAIGVVRDSQNEKIYWFITSDTVDAILEYNQATSVVAPVLVDTGNVLNFSKTNRITGVNVFEGLLAWTDDLNEPRIINIETFKSGSAQPGTVLNTKTQVFGRAFIASDINVIKLKPKTAPSYTAADSVRGGLGTGLNFASITYNFSTPLLEVGDSVSIQFKGVPNWQSGDIISLTTSFKGDDDYTDDFLVRIEITNVTSGGVPPTATITGTVLTLSSDLPDGDYLWNCVLEEEEPMFELSFPRFAYRWRYKENRYSAFSPWTQAVFLPGTFKYTNTNGHNEGMVNNLRSLTLNGFETAPADVDKVEILYKDSNSPAVYRVAEIDTATSSFTIESELIYDIVESNQALRAYDNVPRKALGQEVIGNRLVYANYLQNYTVSDDAQITLSIVSNDITEIKEPEASVKSMRTYQVGVVYLDENGRETPVFTNDNATAIVSKTASAKVNQLQAVSAQTAPSWATHFKYYVKDISNEYYNLALDRYYYAPDGNVWLSFPSAERNKVSTETYLSLKKNHDNDGAVTSPTKYKVLEISNEAPRAVAEKRKNISSNPNVLVGADTGWTALSSGVTSFNFQIENNGLPTTDFVEAVSQGNIYLRFKRNSDESVFYEVETAGFAGDTFSNNDLKMYATLKEPFQETFLDGLTQNDVYTIEVWQYVSQNLPEFDGRFFVKINRDPIIDEALIYSYAQNDADYYELIDDTLVVISPTAGDDPTVPGVDVANAAWAEHSAASPSVEVDGRIEQGRDSFGFYWTAADSAANALVSGDAPYVFDTKLAVGSVIQFRQVTTGTWSDAYEVKSITKGTYTRGGDSDQSDEFGYYWNITLKEQFTEANWDATAIRLARRKRTLPVTFDEDSVIISTTNPAVFETEPADAVDLDLYYEATDAIAIANLGNAQTLDFFNCYSFGNGVESDRIRDDFNAKTISKGVKASTVLEEPYTEDRRKAGMIWSGLFNSISGLNELNQFNQALKITKDLNPIYGSIQKLHARDTDLVALCEDKCFRILANKDALYNADGNTNITSTNNVLGTAMPYAGEFGISKNPETFASYGFRAYFTDKSRGTVIRLSRDGITEIASKGMTDFFEDKFKTLSGAPVGSYDEASSSYNISFFNDETVAFKEANDGWSSRLSFVPECAISLNNEYYTLKNGELYQHSSAARSNFYGVQYSSSITGVINDGPSTIKNFKTASYEGDEGWTLSVDTDQQAGAVADWKKREGIFFNYIKGNSTAWSNASQTGTLDTSEFNVLGIGLAIDARENIVGSYDINFSSVNVSVQPDDDLYVVRAGGSDIELIGTISTVTGVLVRAVNTAGVTLPATNDYFFAAKNRESNTSGIIGYYGEFTMTTSSSDKKELFAVNSEVFMSSE